MKKITTLMLSLILMMFFVSEKSHACTNFLITKGASKDGSTMISYSATHMFFTVSFTTGRQ
jgi:hypothetical protein